ncbi:conserved domain protein [delta proteobacterium NaphS2]|nr:conserved domain protein [delta proteobacterium NaphS2]
MSNLPFDNTIDEKTGLDGHAFLCRAIDEVKFLIQIFGQLPPPDLSMEDIAGGMYAFLNDILDKLYDIDQRLVSGGKEVTA